MCSRMAPIGAFFMSQAAIGRARTAARERNKRPLNRRISEAEGTRDARDCRGRVRRLTAGAKREGGTPRRPRLHPWIGTQPIVDGTQGTDAGLKSRVGHLFASSRGELCLLIRRGHFRPCPRWINWMSSSPRCWKPVRS